MNIQVNKHKTAKNLFLLFYGGKENYIKELLRRLPKENEFDLRRVQFVENDLHNFIDEHLNKVAGVYCRIFTGDELIHLVQLCKDPAYKKLIENMWEITAEVDFLSNLMLNKSLRKL